MGLLKLPWGLTGALLASTYLHCLCAAASPSINVGLKASFTAAPYLLELLETAADENSNSYFPLLDRIAEGHFSKLSTDKELYEQFIQVLENDGHMPDAESLSSYKFALSMRSAAPRIEAHYQYYHTAAEPSFKGEQDINCSTWVLFNNKQYCSPSLDAPQAETEGNLQVQELQFDRVLGNLSASASVLYTDITSSEFAHFHKRLVKTAREGRTSYRVRHRKSLSSQTQPLMVPGYGVALSLKRTDYIVIDDREGEESPPQQETQEKEVKFEDEELADLKPLSTSELLQLGLKASSFIMQSENPFNTLVKLSQDFPKYSSAVASHNASKEFVAEHDYNRAQLVPGGYNVWWMNGLQMVDREIDGLSFLSKLRAERKLINGVRDLGFTAPQAIQLLSFEEIVSVKVESESQRYDWRDEAEGGNVIIWMNDIEKDKRYEDWPESINAMLQRTYPGQLPTVRRDCFNLVLPIDFASSEDVFLVVETLRGFVKRKLNIRIGLVPITSTPASSDQANVLYYLLDSYGLSTAILYLEKSSATKKMSAPNKSDFEAAIEGRNLRPDKVARQLDEILKYGEYSDRIESSKRWMKRLSANSKTPPLFVNGVALPRNENWLQAMSQRVTSDLQAIQTAIFEDSIQHDAWLPQFFLSKAAKRRNSLIVPEDEKNLRIFDMNKLLGDKQDLLGVLPHIEADSYSAKKDWAHMTLVVDLDSHSGERLLASAIVFRKLNPSIELVIMHNPAVRNPDIRLSQTIFGHLRNDPTWIQTVDGLTNVLAGNEPVENKPSEQESKEYWYVGAPFIKALALQPSQNAILLNGRLVGPIPESTEFSLDDLVSLLTYERTKRITPVYNAMETLEMYDKITAPLAGAKVTSIVARSMISEVPDGMFEQATTLRMSKFDVWNSTHTSIEVGDISTSSVQMTVLLDPASENAQKWVSILKALSELDGIYVRLFLNPKERLQELPVKRFYRYVIDSKPNFNIDGSLQSLGASFKGVPQEALLTLSMDVPPAWLVAPKVSVYDLDNIKLSSLKTDVEALYELEHILIEGHSREIPGGAAPRGAQLVLGTERDPHFADTIIMANLGYFQFKANPGFYKIELQQGRSAEIFNIDSIGSQGWSPVPGDESSEVMLMSFQGATLYPRISRKAGMELEDVLEAKTDPKIDFVSRGLNFAQGILGKGKPSAQTDEQAEINIFSVASGHLYERMLNIMMASVMKHTKHTVKFWFIEQFLSPSFKDFIPFLAAEYGFEYEMVTFKWPHWLRAQSEKQREIWGYKILFLDVLFPLSLDKVIFVDADQIVRTDMIELVNHDLQGAPYGFTPMCDSRTEMEGFRFWKQGYWKNFLRGLPYHISALYVVDLKKFRQIAAGDRLRQQYHSLSADPNSLSNLDQDLPNHMQSMLPIHSLPQEWLWCETWCSDESLKEAKTIDLCNNPQTKEPKLDRARRQVPEWTAYDDEIMNVDRKRKGLVAESSTAKKNNRSRTLEVLVETPIETPSEEPGKDEL
ncbi:UDP-glucose:glycoprotein glucosyltransferase-domain-containing protein [Amylocarpus encephaloides]|uniref:UDP-glucose:glycoprotein glucosyltransferase-domain-containing protein n=1 Tax=Amylocarpus encephaloides TaxID=45428 RepID=A0A9P7YCE3_9HELO|nr:UDP-glucose:glycoprotein glucosyltransferase-domain-containing protein [Amylocarpus encephaloides]